jgi:hypothetical protein
MRPRGEIREALCSVFAEQQPCGWRDVLPYAGIDARSPSEVMLVRRTVENMVRAHELVPVGLQKAPGSRVWHQLYELQDIEGQETAVDLGFEALQGAVRSWAEFK